MNNEYSCNRKSLELIYEISSQIDYRFEQGDEFLKMIQDQEGRRGLYDLAELWFNDWTKEHENTDWEENDFWQTVDTWLTEKFKTK